MPLLRTKEYKAALSLARHLNLSVPDLMAVLKSENGSYDFYHSWQEAKKSGGFRTYHSPLEPLRTFQQIIRERVLSRLPVSAIAHGYAKGKSIVTNADAHIKSRSLFALDLSDAFGSTALRYKLKQQQKTKSCLSLAEFGLTLPQFEVMLKLVEVLPMVNSEMQCLPFLPQGGITSPDIFNYCCHELDRRLLQLANNVGGKVTRYADNIFFSMPSIRVDNAIRNAVYRIVQECGFKLNRKKTHHIVNGNRNGVPLRLLGINIIDGDMYLPPETIERYRGLLYRAGLEADHETFAWIKGVVIQVYGGWPPRLAGIYRKGLTKGGHLSP